MERANKDSFNKYHEEWKEKLSKEKQVFTGKAEIDKNEGETASTVSQSKMSVMADKKAQELNK